MIFKSLIADGIVFRIFCFEYFVTLWSDTADTALLQFNNSISLGCFEFSQAVEATSGPTTSTTKQGGSKG